MNSHTSSPALNSLSRVRHDSLCRLSSSVSSKIMLSWRVDVRVSTTRQEHPPGFTLRRQVTPSTRTIGRSISRVAVRSHFPDTPCSGHTCPCTTTHAFVVQSAAACFPCLNPLFTRLCFLFPHPPIFTSEQSLHLPICTPRSSPSSAIHSSTSTPPVELAVLICAGWCYDAMDCWGRSNGDLGSSKGWKSTSSMVR